jgi:PKD repeat protein
LGKYLIKVLFILTIFLCTESLWAQTEYFVKINPITGKFTKISKISGVNWIEVNPSSLTFDETNQTYFFKGDDSSGKFCLYSINAQTGKVLSKPYFPKLSNPKDNVIELQFDNSTKKLYGLHWKDSLKTEFLVTINPSNGAYTIIDSIPGVKWISTVMYTTFDEKNHLYIFRGANSKMEWRLYAFNVNTGQVVSKPLFPNLLDPKDNIIDIKFNNTTQILHGLHWDDSENREYLVSIDRATGSMTKIDSLPGVKWITILPNYTVINENKNQWMFLGGDKNFNWNLNTVDLSNGKIINKVPFPKVCNAQDNLIELHFSKKSNQLFGLHWEANSFKKLKDTAICGNTSLNLNVPYGSTWSNGDTGKILRPLKSGKYTYKKFDICDSNWVIDSFYIKILGEKPFIGKDTSFCHEFSTMLFPSKNFLRYSWNTGSLTKFTIVKNAGTYILTVIDSSMCTMADTIVISKISDLPIAQFDIDKDRQCLNGNKFIITDKSFIHKGTLSYHWNFGNGTSAFFQNVQPITYRKADTFNIQLIVVSNLNCSDTMSRPVIVWPQPNAVFNLVADSVCWKNEFLKVNNTGTSIKDSAHYVWDFGDGSFDYNHTPYLKKYPNKTAAYTVKLKVTSKQGCKDSTLQKIMVLQQPKPDIIINDSVQCFMSNSYFFKAKIGQNSDPVKKYTWNFGNGTSDTGAITHEVKYQIEGKFKVQLTAISEHNCKDSLFKFIEVKPQARANFIAEDVCENNHVKFINQSINASSFFWRFGDGLSQTMDNPRHLYKTIKTTTFNATLLALSVQGCSDSITKAITVNALPESNFNFTTSGKHADFTAVDKNLSTYYWDFGDGHTATTNTPFTIYNYSKISNGQYLVCLLTTNTADCSSETCKNIKITDLVTNQPLEPTINVYPNPTTGIFTLEINQLPATCEVINNIGQILYHSTLNQTATKLDLEIAKGIYWLRIGNSNGVVNYRLVIVGKD